MRATVLIAAAALSFQPLARADLITYTQQVNANGSLGGVNFANALLTFSFSGDTANVTNTSPGFFENILGEATVTVAGIGTATFTDMMSAFVNQNTPCPGCEPGFAGIARSTDPRFVLASTENPAFATYTLTTSIGPLSGLMLAADRDWSTDMGSFFWDSGCPECDSQGTYTANTAAAVPEPASYGFVCVGLAIIGIYKQWRAVPARPAD